MLLVSLFFAGCGGGSGQEAVVDVPPGVPSVTSAFTSATSSSVTVMPVASTPRIEPVIVNPVVSGGITTRFTASRVSGVAPLSVFFDASSTTSVMTSRPFQDLDYQWNFGDAGSGVWGVGSRAGISSRNTSRGPVASHVFEAPGTYSVTVTATDGSNAAANTVQITVQDPNTVFSGNTICFSTSSNFTGCPAGAALQTASDYSVAINSYQATKKRMLFRRGETWTAVGSANLVVTGPGIVGAFGAGALPKFLTPTNGLALELSSPTTPGIKDWRVMDIEIDGGRGDTRGVSAGGGIDQVLLLRLNIHDVRGGVSLSHLGLDAWNAASAMYRGHAIWDQFSMVDCRVYDLNSAVDHGSDVAAFLAASNMTIMGNTLDNVNGAGHVLRTPYIGKGVVSNNYVGRPSSSGAAFKFHAPKWSGAGVITGRYSEKVIVSDNTFEGAQSSGTVAIEPQNNAEDERHRDIIFERNYILLGTASQYGLSLKASESNMTVRNNVINASRRTSGYVTAINLREATAGYVGSGLNVYNNTLYSSGAPSFIGITIESGITAGVMVKNNLGYAPGATLMNRMVEGGGEAYAVLGGNTTNAQLLGTSPLFSTLPAPTVTSLATSHFKISASSYAAGAGVSLPITTDFFLANRLITNPDIGAVIH